jgi:hypothetical protein
MLAIMWVAGSGAVIAQKSGRDHLTVRVTVSPICTVAVTPGELSDKAVDVQCRNLSQTQPEPDIAAAAEASVDDPTHSDDASGDSVQLVVINF